MERKTTQRIIGILVMMALVIILMPLLLDKNEAVTQTASIKPPPFPDQPVTANNTTALDTKKAAESIVITPDIAKKLNQATAAVTASAASATAPAPAAVQPAPAKPVVAAAAPQQPQADAQAPQFQPVATTPLTSTPDSVQTTMTTAPSSTTPAPASTAPKFAMISTPTTAPNVIPVESKPATLQTPNAPAHHKVKLAKATRAKKISPHHVVKTAAAKHTINTDTVADVSKLAWAIQMGSFKNKENAIHLADRLRTAGYKAFMHDVKSPKGNVQTRVYIGPEYKQASAAKLSLQLEQKLKLHGFIVPYKPLEI